MGPKTNDILFGNSGQTPPSQSSPARGPAPSQSGTNHKNGYVAPSPKLKDQPKYESGKDLDRPYFIGRMNEEGVLDYTSDRLQFIIPVNSEVRFHLDYGNKISKGARLVVNKPKKLPNGEVEYTITQPLTTDPEKIHDWKGSQLDTQYLEAVDAHPESSEYMLEFRVFFDISGSFFVQIVYEDDQGQVSYTKPQYVNVEPVMTANNQEVRGKELSVLTVMSRCLGKLTRWPAVLKNIRECGYNAVHFAPFQQYGESYSHYSIADQTTMDDLYFDSPSTIKPDQRISELKKVLEASRKQGLLSMVDIVLNHTANNSEWIKDHPDAGYSTDICPHLWAAWELDYALQQFSIKFEKKQVPECPCAPFISNESDLGQVMHYIQTKMLDGLRLHEFFLSDVNTVVQNVLSPALQNIDSSQMDQFKRKFEKKGWFSWDRFHLMEQKLTVGMGHGPKRRQVSLKMPDAAYFFMIVHNKNRTSALKEVESLLHRLNDHWTHKVRGFMGDARGAIEGTIRYSKLECRRTKINVKEGNWIVDPYFSELKNAQKSKVAHNGWVMGHNCMEDFAYVGWHYLRRSICIWGDCIKLRYGKCPADSPYLWQHMTKYVQDMAMVADGFRLDNTHSTPIHVAEYLLQQARSKNKNLFVMAELFTDSGILDGLFCRKLNLNAMVRELQTRTDTGQLAGYFHHLTCKEAVQGSIDEKYRDLKGQSYKTLWPGKPQDMLYDCTHDNPSVKDKFTTGRMALPHLGIAAASDLPIASTWGYDQLVGEQIHCVFEKRNYAIVEKQPFATHDPTIYPEPRSSLKAKKVQVPKEQPKKQPQPTSFDYEFSIESGSARKVQVAGEFTGWKPSVNLSRQGMSSTWTGKITLPIDSSKQSYQYKFVINDKDWVTNQNLPTTSDGRGNVNNNLVVPRSGGGPSSTFITDSSTGLIVRSSRDPKPGDDQRVFEDICYPRMKLNQVHEHCTRLNAEIFMHHQDDCIMVIRQLEPDIYQDFDCYIFIMRFCFYNKGGDYNYKQSFELPGFMSEVVFAGYLEIPDAVYGDSRLKDTTNIYGPRGCKLHSFTQLEGKFCGREKLSESNEKLHFHFMPPSFTCCIKVKSRQFIKQSISKINAILDDPRLDSMYDKTPSSGINHVLFRCDNEEKDISGGRRGPYGFNEYGQMPYSGIASLMHMFRKTKLSKDMGCEIFNNMREGDWLLDYTTNRIREYADSEPSIGLHDLADFLADYLGAVKQLPGHLKPKYGTKVIETVYNRTVQEVMSVRMRDDFMRDTEDPFAQKLALAIFQMYGRIPSVYFKEHKDSMCAGLTHFSTGYMRCWGRDTFIALRGLFIATGLDNEARETILFFAKVYRHGLLPNLHDGGHNTRFNSRDAPWFFLQAIKDYVLLSDEGEQFLSQEFELNFKDDDQMKHQQKQKGRVLSILALIIEIVQRHAQGIEFREWNAGTQIDAHMKDPGFQVKIDCDIDKTGFCFGGNRDNCGTWMDKMGSSDYAQNRGKPATPRDGAPIELVAMQYSILTWLATMHQKGTIKQGSIQITRAGRQREIKFSEWAQKMQDNFEKHFWVPVNKNEDRNYVIEPSCVNRRGIYKDVLGSADKYTDYQLRCNICIAMSYAPELFDPQHAKICLENVANILMEKGCMGIKTLDPSDKNYNGDYHNDDLAHGINYHQGPEWVWPVGFFLKSQLLFKGYQSKDEALQDTMKWLLPHKQHILTNRWQGLPELTNSHGSHCPGSCVTQAWSISTIVDALRDLYYFQ